LTGVGLWHTGGAAPLCAASLFFDYVVDFIDDLKV
jgi:hypothetical protein